MYVQGSKDAGPLLSGIFVLAMEIRLSVHPCPGQWIIKTETGRLDLLDYISHTLQKKQYRLT
jgi:hypothetical protein